MWLGDRGVRAATGASAPEGATDQNMKPVQGSRWRVRARSSDTAADEGLSHRAVVHPSRPVSQMTETDAYWRSLRGTSGLDELQSGSCYVRDREVGGRFANSEHRSRRPAYNARCPRTRKHSRCID